MIIELLPLQMVLLLTLAIPTVGVVFTVIVSVGFVMAVLTQARVLEPLMVYIVVAVGDTVKLVPEVLLGSKV